VSEDGLQGGERAVRAAVSRQEPVRASQLQGHLGGFEL